MILTPHTTRMSAQQPLHPAPLSPHIRPAIPADAAAIVRWIRELAHHEGRPEAATIDIDGLCGALWPKGRPPIAEAWIIESPRGVGVGYLWWSLSLSTFTGRPRMLLEDIAITPHARAGGLGAFAMRWLAAKATELGCDCIDWSVVENNPRAMAFYDRLGARQTTGGVHYRWAGESLAAAARESSVQDRR